MYIFTKHIVYFFYIRAPTPIRALVHRRTLVTAGLIFLYNFHFYLVYNHYSSIIFFIGLLTIALASILAIVEKDIIGLRNNYLFKFIIFLILILFIITKICYIKNKKFTKQKNEKNNFYNL